ncbi:MAG: hypothetical protein SFV21_10940 [Rhodospirillaceae bacterium]|nr:hypothetical protein [Rhodospirillaceae bacterium]
MTFVAQVGFGWWAQGVKPYWANLPPAPRPSAVGALAFGDPQFLFRALALRVQTAGDFGGRVVPIREYDQELAVRWLEVLDSLDSRSVYAIGLAEGLFGQSQNANEIGPIIAFMSRHVDRDPQRKWPWMFGAISLARYRMKDQNLALSLARQLAAYEVPSITPWATMTPAFILEDAGDIDGAKAVIAATLRRFAGRLSPDDQTWTASYLDYLDRRAKGLAPPRKSWLDPQ